MIFIIENKNLDPKFLKHGSVSDLLLNTDPDLTKDRGYRSQALRARFQECFKKDKEKYKKTINRLSLNISKQPK